MTAFQTVHHPQPCSATETAERAHHLRGDCPFSPAAVYGSCLYRRFSPSILEQVGEPEADGFGERLHRCVEYLGGHLPG